MALAAVAPACLAAPASSPATLPVVWSAGPAAEYLLLVGDLAAPPMEGRGPGTAGIEKARDYIVQHFKDAGLAPAFDGNFTQPFPLRGSLKAQRQSLAAFDAKGKEVLDAKPVEDFAALGFSPDANFRGPAVWVGYGISNPQADYDSYEDANHDALAGKIAVAFRYEPQDANGASLWARGRADGPQLPWSQAASLVHKGQWAAAHGAVALLVVNPPSQDQDKTPRPTDETGVRAGLKIPVFQISSETFGKLLRQAGLDANDAALFRMQDRADKAAGKPLPLGDLVIAGAVSLRATTYTVHNVAGVLRGAGALAEEVIVISSHYDHLGYGPFGSRTGEHAIHPGADDNASGSAGVMMLAKRFARLAADANAPKSRRSILFVTFSGEERGLIGSQYLVDHLSEAGLKPQQIVANLNMDMIGRVRDDRLYVLAADTGAEWREMLKSAAKGTGLEVLPSGTGLSGSDHASFYNGLRVPVLHFFSGLHGDYHTPRDTADLINGPGAVKVLDVVANVAAELWTRPARLTYVVPKAATAPGGAGPSVYLGIVLDEPMEGDKGVPILSVLPGSPADAAGVKPGDVLLALNGKPIDKLKDLLDALGAASPGDKVKLTIRRDGKSVEAEATLRKRGT
jgi:hypothetical protein